MQLPLTFVAVTENKFAGGVEPAPMSTTFERCVAESYAGSGMSSVFRIEFDLGNRGASLKFLSQYPAEEEMVFPPGTLLTCRQVKNLDANKRELELSAAINPDTKLREVSQITFPPRCHISHLIRSQSHSPRTRPRRGPVGAESTACRTPSRTSTGGGAHHFCGV